MKRPTNWCIHAGMGLENDEHGAGTECNQADVLVQGAQKQDETSTAKQHIWVQQIRVAAGTILQAGRAPLVLFQTVDSTWHIDVAKEMISWWSRSTEMIPVLPNIVVQIHLLFTFIYHATCQCDFSTPSRAQQSILQQWQANCHCRWLIAEVFLFCCERMQKVVKCYWGTRLTDLLRKLVWRLDSLLRFAQTDEFFFRTSLGTDQSRPLVEMAWPQHLQHHPHQRHSD